MYLSFRTKLLLGAIGVVAVVLATVDFQLGTAFSEELLAQVDARLEGAARATADWLDEGEAPREAALHAARATQARASIVAVDGRLLADSALSERELARAENHGSRPEVVEARLTGTGRATRDSATLGKATRYLAVRARDGRVVRLGLSLERIQEVLAGLRMQLLRASLPGLLVAVLLGFVFAELAARPLRATAEAATRIARGEPAPRLPSGARDELGSLSRSVEAMATQLADRIAELTAQRDRLSSILEGMVDGVLVLEAGGLVSISNPAANQILELGSALAGRSLAETVRHPAALAALRGALEEGCSAELELEAVGRTGRTVLLGVRPLPAGAGGGAIAVLHDVTRLRRLEASRRDFVSNVSHELRTPVATIQACAESLLDGALKDPGTAGRFADAIHRNACRLGRLVADLLKLSRLEVRTPEQYARTTVRLRDLVEEVAGVESEAAAEVGTTVTLEVPPELTVWADPDGVEQIVLNLLENAIKHGRRPGQVAVRGARDGHWLELTVEDDGPGIESRHLPRIFERFYQVDPGRSLEDRGTGLGLAIVSHLAQAMGGGVRVDSEVGRGSRFTVRLPCGEA